MYSDSHVAIGTAACPTISIEDPMNLTADEGSYNALCKGSIKPTVVPSTLDMTIGDSNPLFTIVFNKSDVVPS